MKIEDTFAKNEILFNNRFKNISDDSDNAKNNNAIGFSDVLKNCIEDTNEKIATADSTTNKFIKGEDVNIDDVMVKNQEASLSLQFLTQTRDKLLDGYNQLSKLQL